MGVLTQDMKRVLREQRLGFIATVCPDGTPNLSPKGTTTYWDEDHLVFADIRSPETVRNLRANPHLEVNVVDGLLRKGYRFKGTAEVLTEGPLYEQALAFFRGETGDLDYVLPGSIRAVVLMKVERALPLISPRYDRGASEADIVRQWEPHWLGLWATLKERLRQASGRV